MRKVSSVLIFALVFMLLYTSASPVLAMEPESKEEVIYGILNRDGDVNNLYVVNIFSGGKIIDYGNYSEISNMTTAEKLSQSGDKITIDTKAEKFYYQGTMERKELPWDIAIKYYLDGKEISGNDIAGKSGEVEIAISIRENTNISKPYFANYALQISLSLDNKLFSNIRTEDATVAEAGSKKQLAYTVLPGNSMDISVRADVEDFEMDSIEINGIRLALGISVDSNEITGQISELVEAIEDLDSGAGDLLEGLNELSEGMRKFTDGMKAFKDGLGQFSAGAEQLNYGAAELKDGLGELSAQNDALIQAALAIQQATFDSVNAELSEMGLGLPTLTPENYSTVLASIPGLAPVKDELDGAIQFSQGIIGYTGGVAQLSAGASELAKGTAEFRDSATEIADSANELYMAGAEINAGLKQVRDGLAAYKDGTREFKGRTAEMDSQLDKKLDEILGSISGQGDDEVVSFASEKNTNVLAVQFVLKTDPILPPAVQELPPSEPVQESFWQRLVKLFQSIFN